MDSLYEPTPLERFCNWSPVCLRVTVFVALLVFLDVVATVCTGGIGRLAFFALMPAEEGTDFWTWLAGLDGAELGRLVRDSRDRADFFLRLSLPKFEAEWTGELKDVLTALGLELAFDDTGLADFSLLGDNPYGYHLSQVIHATKLEVNEEGTRAAAATVVEATAGSAAPTEEPQGIELDFDRPFLYGIVDLENGVPLFLGTFE